MRNLLQEFTNDSDNNQITRVVIIGGGAAGLSALGALKRHKNCEVVLIEKEPRIGGVWYLCDYPGLSIHARSFSFRFYDFHSPVSVTQHATRNEILTYLNSYITHFQLGEQIFFQQQAVKIAYHEDGSVVHKCHLEVEDLCSRDRVVLRCDYVVCAQGFSNGGTPHIPDFPKNGEEFKGKVLHSSELNEALLGKIKQQRAKVCLLGAGKSAYDLALQFEKFDLLTETTWVYKKFLWGLNYDFLYSNRSDKITWSGKHGQYLYLFRRFPDSPLVKKMAEEMITSGMLLNIESDNFNIHETRTAIYKPREISLLRSKATRIKSSVHSLTGVVAKLESGHEVVADYIVCCTGYARARNLPDITFHTKEGELVPIDPTEQPLLYRGMIDLRIPRVIIFTGEVMFSAQLFGFSIAAEWVCDYLTDLNHSTPADLEMKKMAVVEDDVVINAKVKPDYLYSWISKSRPSYGYFIGEASMRYLWQILTDMGIPENVAVQLYGAAENERNFEGMTNFLRRRLARRLGRPGQIDHAVAMI